MKKVAEVRESTNLHVNSYSKGFLYLLVRVKLKTKIILNQVKFRNLLLLLKMSSNKTNILVLDVNDNRTNRGQASILDIYIMFRNFIH